MRMVDRVHRHTAHRRALAHPACATCFPNRNILVLDIAYLADCRHAINRDYADLTRRQSQLRGTAFLCHELSEASSAPRHLTALARLKFDVVYLRAQRNV